MFKLINSIVVKVLSQKHEQRGSTTEKVVSYGLVSTQGYQSSVQGDSVEYCDETHICKGRLEKILGGHLHHIKTLQSLFIGNLELLKDFDQDSSRVLM